MSDGGRLGKDRYLDSTLSDSKFQTTIQLELGNVWRAVEKLERSAEKEESGQREIDKKVEVLVTKMDFMQKIIWSCVTGLLGVLIKIVYDLLIKK